MPKKVWYVLRYKRQGRMIEERFGDQSTAYRRGIMLKKNGMAVEAGTVPRSPMREAWASFRAGVTQAMQHLKADR